MREFLVALNASFTSTIEKGLYTTRKIHTKLHPGLEWRIFYILTSEDNDYFTDSLVYDRNIFECSWKVFGNLRNFYGKCSGTFVCHSEIFGKWSEILGKSPNQHVYIINSLAYGFYAGNLN